MRTICRIRLAWTERGRDAVHPRGHAAGRPKLDDEQEARILAICQSAPPAGAAAWTLRMVAHRAVELAIVPSLSHETVRRTLKKTVAPGHDPAVGRRAPHNARYVERMEDVLAVYRRPVDPRVPVICFDESGKELAQELYPARPGRVRRVDDEVVRKGSASLLLAVAPFTGWRHITVTRRRTYKEWAHAMRDLVDVHFPDAERLVIVLDNLNIHVKSALYTIFPPEEAFRIAQKLELHYTPGHGSWLNIAEVEFSVLHRQCLRAARVPPSTGASHRRKHGQPWPPPPQT